MRGNRDLRQATVAAWGCALLALAMPLDALSLIFAAPLAFLLPGYAIVSAVFVRARLLPPVTLTLSVGMSLSTLTLGALLLDYAPGGVRGLWWAVLLAAVTTAGCWAAALRRPAAERSPLLSWPALGRSQAALLAAAAVVAAAALTLAFATLPADRAIGYTELWMQPYAAGGETGVRVGVGSNEQKRTAYLLRVRFGRDGATTVRRFALRPGESRVLRATAPSARRAPSRVTAALLRPGQSDRPYRRVTGWTPPKRAPR